MTIYKFTYIDTEYSVRNFRRNEHGTIDLEFMAPITEGEWWPFTFIGPNDGPVSDAIDAFIRAQKPVIAPYVEPDS